MEQFKIENDSGIKIDLTPAFQKVEPYMHLIDPSVFPIPIYIKSKKNFQDRSHTNKEIIVLKINTNESYQEIEWVFCHEFAHFIAYHNQEIYDAVDGMENDVLKRFFQVQFGLNWRDPDINKRGREIFHDFIPSEVFANGFATMVTKYFYKRHPIDKALNYFNLIFIKDKHKPE